MSDILDENKFKQFKEKLGDSAQLLINSYINMANPIIKTIKINYNNKKYDELFVQSHSLKSPSMQIGAMRVANLAQKIEEKCKAQEYDDLLISIEELIIEYKILEPILKK